jgi:hypothetical protein
MYYNGGGMASMGLRAISCQVIEGFLQGNKIKPCKGAFVNPFIIQVKWRLTVTVQKMSKGEKHPKAGAVSFSFSRKIVNNRLFYTWPQLFIYVQKVNIIDQIRSYPTPFVILSIIHLITLF